MVREYFERMNLPIKYAEDIIENNQEVGCFWHPFLVNNDHKSIFDTINWIKSYDNYMQQKLKYKS